MNKFMKFVVLMGLVSLFADITYEGMRSIIGGYMKELGIKEGIIGVVIGTGEMISYSLRAIFGILNILTGNPWLYILLGYSITGFSVPMIGIVNSGTGVITLVILERFGKALRSPARDSIVSTVGEKIGRGKAFGIAEVLDQLGAILGPFIVFLILSYTNSYSTAILFLGLFTPLIITFILLAKSQFDKIYKESKEMKELLRKERLKIREIPKKLYFYILFSTISVMGFFSWGIIAGYLEGKIVRSFIPILYLLAMGIDAAIAFPAGYLYDKYKMDALFIPIILTPFVTLIFLKIDISTLILSSVLFGVIIGFQETVYRSAIGDITPPSQRPFAYGLFSMFYGLSLLISNSLFGFMIELGLGIYVFMISVGFEIIAAIILYFITRSQPIKS